MRTGPHIPRPIGPSRRGFTLLEVLLAVTMYGLMIGGLISTVYGAMRLRDRTRSLVEQSFTTDRAFHALRADLRAMAPPSGQLQRPIYGISQDGSTGRQDELEFGTFSGYLHPDQVWGDAQLVRYKLVEPAMVRTGVRTGVGGTGGTSGQGLVLARYVMRNLLSPVDVEEDPQILQRDVLGLEFSYYFEEEWLDSWDSENMEDAIPEAVKVRITYETPDDRAHMRDIAYSDSLSRQESQVLVVPITIKPISEAELVDEEGQESF